MPRLAMSGAASAGAFGFNKLAQAVNDAYFSRNVLLLPGNGTNGAQNNTFLDSSSNAFSITRNGNATQGTFSPFSQTGWSAFFGGSGNYIQGNITTLAAASTSTFTIEFWYYPTSFSVTSPIIGDMQPTGSLNYMSAQIDTTGKPALYWYDGNAQTCTANTALTLNSWNYVAIRVSSNAISIYVNSASPSSLTGTTTLTGRTGQANFAIAQFSTTQNTSGYLSNVRVSTIARTISAIPTAAFTSDADTRILVLGANRFIDTGVGGSTLTPTGASVQAFSPFAPTAAYSAATNGGSGYFDGTGDYLVTASSANLALGTSDFTYETWFYPTAAGGSRPIVFEKPNRVGLGGGIWLVMRDWGVE